MSFVIVFLALPCISIISGSIAIIFGFKSKRVIKTAVRESGELKTRYSGKMLLNVGFTSGFIGVLSGIFVIAGFIYFVKAFRAPESEIVGNVDIQFFGEEDIDEIASQSIFLLDSTIMTLGFRNSKDTLLQNQIVILKTDTKGNQIFSKYFEGFSPKLIDLQTGEFILTSIIISQDDYNARRDLKILKLDINGNILLERVLELSENSNASHNALTSDGNIIIGGKHHFGSEGEVVNYILKLNQDLNILWMKKSPELNVGNYLYSTATTDSGFGTLGFYENDSMAIDSLFLTKFDSNGLIEWRFRESLGLQGYRIRVAEDNSLMVLANRYTVERNLEGIMLKFSPDGKLIWEKVITDEGYYMMTDFLPHENGWLVVGWTPRRESIMKIKSQNIKHWDTYTIVSLNDYGERIFQFSGKEENIAVWDLSKVKENYYILTGFGGEREKGDPGTLENNDVGILKYKFE